ncbi:MAG: hypothetical protein NC418_09755, partial [Muribaculaceae bacterium]|nr:hypothetical protein [Muribaculaceae bacterium]
SMNYVLTGADKSIVDLTLTTDHPNRPEIAFNSVPVQRNYRTNIFGALLTNPANFEVEIDKEFGGNHDVEIKVVETAEELKEAIAQGGDIVLPAGKTIDVSEFITGDAENLSIDEPTTLHIEGTLANEARGRINVTAPLIVEGGNIEVGEDSYGIFNIKNGGSLKMTGTKITHNNKKDGTPIGLRENGSIELENVEINSGFGTVCSWRATSSGTISAKNCIFRSTSNEARGGLYTYAFNIEGPVEVVLDNCEVSGVQGGLAAVQGAKVTVNGGKYFTHKLADEPKAQNHYAAYAAQNGRIIINSGDFYSEGMMSILNGDNDNPGDPFGSFEVYGGRFSDQGYDGSIRDIIHLSDDYVWQPIEGDPIFHWTVVKK